jgi:hypothetical protein
VPILSPAHRRDFSSAVRLLQSRSLFVNIYGQWLMRAHASINRFQALSLDGCDGWGCNPKRTTGCKGY